MCGIEEAQSPLSDIRECGSALTCLICDGENSSPTEKRMKKTPNSASVSSWTIELRRPKPDGPRIIPATTLRVSAHQNIENRGKCMYVTVTYTEVSTTVPNL